MSVWGLWTRSFRPSFYINLNTTSGSKKKKKQIDIFTQEVKEAVEILSI